MKTFLTCSCLFLGRHNQNSPEEGAAIAVLEKTQIIFDLLSREEKVSAANSASPGGVAAVHHTCEHMEIC